MSDMAAQIDRLNQIIFFLAVTIVFVVGCWLAEDNLRSLTTRRPRVEHCPLHRVPATECRDRHKLDVPHDDPD